MIKVKRYLNIILSALLITTIFYSVLITRKYQALSLQVNNYKDAMGLGAARYKGNAHPKILFSKNGEDNDSIKILKRLQSIYEPGFIIEEVRQNGYIDTNAIEFFNTIEPKGKLYDVVLQPENGIMTPPLRRPIAAITENDVFILTEKDEFLSFISKYHLKMDDKTLCDMGNFIGNVYFEFRRGMLIRNESEIPSFDSMSDDVKLGTRFIFEPVKKQLENNTHEIIEFFSWNTPDIYYWKVEIKNGFIVKISHQKIGYAGNSW